MILKVVVNRNILFIFEFFFFISIVVINFGLNIRMNVFLIIEVINEYKYNWKEKNYLVKFCFYLNEKSRRDEMFYFVYN